MARPLLDNIELQQVQEIETGQDQVLVQHDVPALEGDFLQRLDRRATQVTLTGVLTGAEVADGLKALREKYRAAQPVPFVADIATATKVDQVMIEEMGVRELAGKPERFEYGFTLREFIAPPPDETIPTERVNDQVQEQASDLASQQMDNVNNELGALEVQVELGDGGDYSRIVVVVEGATANGEPFATRIEEETGGIYRLEAISAGTYIVRAVVR
jgi:hypothetical protein